LTIVIVATCSVVRDGTVGERECALILNSSTKSNSTSGVLIVRDYTIGHGQSTFIEDEGDTTGLAVFETQARDFKRGLFGHADECIEGTTTDGQLLCPGT
jgi:hypothetical protein